jgi:hypothetical protein
LLALILTAGFGFVWVMFALCFDLWLHPWLALSWLTFWLVVFGRVWSCLVVFGRVLIFGWISLVLLWYGGFSRLLYLCDESFGFCWLGVFMVCTSFIAGFCCALLGCTVTDWQSHPAHFHGGSYGDLTGADLARV